MVGEFHDHHLQRQENRAEEVLHGGAVTGKRFGGAVDLGKALEGAVDFVLVRMEVADLVPERDAPQNGRDPQSERREQDQG